MKHKLFILLVLFSVLSACSSPEEMPTTESVMNGQDSKGYPLSTRTGISDVDIVLEAVQAGGPDLMRELFQFTKAACMNTEGLGGPPGCRAGETEGTQVEVLPILGSEGSFLRRSEVDAWQGIDVDRIYAIYRVSDVAFSDKNYPAGEYGIMLLGLKNRTGIVLQVTDGKIVRIDYVFDTSPTTLTESLKRNASELVLVPTK